MKIDRLQKGINVFASQLRNPFIPKLHHKRQLQDKNFAQIKDWGMDHVRLCVHPQLLAEEGKSASWIEDGWEILHQILLMTKKQELAVVINLLDAASQEQLEAIWGEMSRRFANTEEDIAFELLDPAPLDKSERRSMELDLAGAVAAIRRVSVSRTVILDYQIDSLLKDPNVYFGFSFFDPYVFTCQKDVNCKVYVDYEQSFQLGHQLFYPAAITGSEMFINKNPQHQKTDGRYIKTNVDIHSLRAIGMSGLFAFRRCYPEKPMYCGAFGVSRFSDADSRYDWVADVLELLRELDAGRAYYLYQGAMWGIVDEFDERRVDFDTVELLTR